MLLWWQDFLRALAAAVEPNTKALEKYKRMADPHITPADDSAASTEGGKLTSRGLYKHVQVMLHSHYLRQTAAVPMQSAGMLLMLPGLIRHATFMLAAPSGRGRDRFYQGC